ncbi:hypothetical protein [Catenulispora sp. GP43]|uniref:hypothetical protein n=1 Tax=Catenulispora sp. GP43 TaxID=3156263 RepID=UPI003517BEF8
MTTVADNRIQAWRKRYAAEIAEAADGVDQALAWWAGLGGDGLLQPVGDGRWQRTEAGSAFADLFWEPAGEELAQEVIAAAEAAGAQGFVSAAASKGAPAAAAYYALGAAEAARLPGGFGEFLIAADEVAAILPDLERLLAGAEREALVERVRLWLDYGGNGSAAEPSEILDGLLRVFRRASDQGLGVAAVPMTF